MELLSCGEALIDLVPLPDDPGRFQALPGGSPMNVAVGIARLGRSAGFLGVLSRDRFGDKLLEHLRRERVDCRRVIRGSRPTRVALVLGRSTVDRDEPAYSFCGERPADETLTERDLPDTLPRTLRAVHFGSLSLVLEPTAGALRRLAARRPRSWSVSLDLNVRLGPEADAARWRAALEAWLPLCDLLKLSRGDLALLHGTEGVSSRIDTWLHAGPQAVVLTAGSQGATWFRPGGSIHEPAPPIDAVDPIGAGDAFTAGLLTALREQDALGRDALGQLDDDAVHRALRFANRVAALTCTRHGADPPRRPQLDAHPWGSHRG
jgi:fructokinase